MLCKTILKTIFVPRKTAQQNRHDEPAHFSEIHFDQNAAQSLMNKGARLDPTMGLTGRCCH
jgi:hypothetical protein